MQNGRLQWPWEPLWLTTDCSHKFSLHFSSKDHYLTFPIDAELWPSSRWQKHKQEYIERIHFLLGSYWIPVKKHLFSVCLTGVQVYLQFWQSVMWTSWLGLGLFSLLYVNKMLSHFIKDSSERAMGYFGSTVLGKKLVFYLLLEFFKHIWIPLYSSCMKWSILILLESWVTIQH